MYTILKEKQDEEVIEETGACLTYKSEIDLIYDLKYAKIDWSDIVRPLWLNFIKYEGVVVNYS